MNLNQVTIPSVDLVKSISFYEKLGLKLIVSALPHYARFECPEGDSTFSLHKVKHMSKNSGISIYFECAKVDEKFKALSDEGIIFDEPPTDKRWLWREARLRDPDGNHIILYFGGKNRKNPPWRV